MMNKTKSPKWYGLKNGMVLISIAIVISLTATFETKIVAQDPGSEPIVFVNGKKSDMKNINKMNHDNIQSMNVLKDSVAVRKYGKDAKNGAIEVVTKDTLRTSKVGKMEAVKVVGYGTTKDSLIARSFSPENFPNLKDNPPLVFLDGKKIDIKEINTYSAHNAIFIKGDEAVKKYGEEGKNGVLLFFTSEQLSSNEGITVRSLTSNKQPLYLINGQPVTEQEFKSVKPDDIYSINVLKDKASTMVYGDRGKNGVIMMNLKKEAAQKLVNNLTIVPNPASDKVEINIGNIESKNNLLDVKIVDDLGREFFNGKRNGPKFTLSVSGFASGIYIVVVNDNGKIYQGNLSIKH